MVVITSDRHSAAGQAERHYIVKAPSPATPRQHQSPVQLGLVCPQSLEVGMRSMPDCLEWTVGWHVVGDAGCGCSHSVDL